jgi:hypothetical protein
MKKLALAFLLFLASPSQAGLYQFSLVCDPMQNVDGFKVYFVIPNAAWVTVPYKEINTDGKQAALLEADLEAVIPTGTARVYVVPFNSAGDGPAKMRTINIMEIKLNLPASARITKQASWW